MIYRAMSVDEVNSAFVAVCGNNSPHWIFWNTTYVWHTNEPNLSRCFQMTAMTWVAVALGLILALVRILALVKMPRVKHRVPSKLYVFYVLKQVFIVCLIAADVANILSAYAGGPEPIGSKIAILTLMNSAISILLLLLISVLFYCECIKMARVSSLYFYFWLYLSAASIINLRTVMMHGTEKNFRQKIGEAAAALSFTGAVGLLMLHSFVGSVCTEPDKWTPPKEQLSFLVVYKPKPLCPQETASFLSFMFYSWFTRLSIKGLRKPVQFSDLWRLRSELRSACIMLKVENVWAKLLKKRTQRKSRKNSTPSLVRALAASAWSMFLISGAYHLASTLLGFLIPTFVSRLINFVEARNSGSATVYIWHGYLYAGVLTLLVILRTLFHQQHVHLNFSVGMNVRSAVVGLVYRKALRLSSRARQSYTIGEIVNLMSVDAMMLENTSVQLHALWETPLTTVICFVLAYNQLGWSVAISLAVALSLIPLNTFIANKTKTLQVKLMRFRDKRIKLLDQMFGGIKLVKMFAWEEAFKTRITKLRNQEVNYVRSIVYMNALIAVTMFCAPLFIAMAAFAAYVLSSPNHILDAQKTFVSLTLFSMISSPLTGLPQVVASLAQGYVSIRRVRRFLLLTELQQACLPPPYKRAETKSGTGGVDHAYPEESDNFSIIIRGGTLGWEPGNILFRNLNFSVPKGKLYIVVGAVGTGKSSLLLAILNEMFRASGEITRQGSIAYVPQQAWCMNATVKANILFGSQMDPRRYKEAISMCCLLPDLKQLPQGDLTEIGERGINLSGGQKQRISLARAVYQQADIYLLDDPLSAVDAHVANSLFEDVIGPRGLLKETTRVLVTHRLVNLEEADQIVCLSRTLAIDHFSENEEFSEGVEKSKINLAETNMRYSVGESFITEMGTFSELMQENGTFACYFNSFTKEEWADVQIPDDDNEQNREYCTENLATNNSCSSQAEGAEQDKRHFEQPQCRDIHRLGSSIGTSKRLVEEEKSATGGLRWDVTKTYIMAYGRHSAVFTAVSYVLFILSSVGTNLWIRHWSQHGTTHRQESSDNADTRDYFLGVYGLFVILQTLSTFAILISQAHGTAYASNNLHLRLLESVLRAPSSFFDTTPTGRIVNRFSKDIEAVDMRFPMCLRVASFSLGTALSSLILICVALPWFIVPLIPLTLALIGIQRVYIRTARQLKRIDSVRRSPIFCHFQESLLGSTLLRAYSKVSQFVAISDYLVDESQMSRYALISCQRWMSVRIEMIGHISTLTACLLFLATNVSPSYAGLIITHTMSVAIALMNVLRSTANLENCFVDVERIKEYSEIPSEAPLHLEERDLDDAKWPTGGEIVFKNYSTRYREGLPLTLKSISLHIRSGEKLGIVGRTGAGKSTLTLALFRLIEATEGHIFIDGVDIGKIGLHDLRSKITVIPQDPVLFAGTLRFNLDPTKERSDEELWAALEGAHMKEFIEEQPNKLDFICAEGGWNLSAGQRQLVCMARALLRKARILILDEATAAVDVRTDTLIQDTIRTMFASYTVLTIAHRLSTVMDYDRILVLKDGTVAECDTPWNLLADSNSLFYAMAKEADIIA